jgi:hypothetical protein
MTRDIVSVTADSSLAEVVALMEARRIKRLLVLEQGWLAALSAAPICCARLSNFCPKHPLPPDRMHRFAGASWRR